ncbi:Domain of uncharacterised function DUF1829 [uncultured Clostridium sp.]|nr:Domain of uncharacterised function DUF1829 [uncultured Clostridium sp.]SCI96235.1 Domain of uncharacterised function DUF1829 [uncultured Clostridium sp.]
MKELIDNYYKWLKQNTIVNELGEYTEVTTPFLDRHNDCIQFYMKKDSDNNIYLTDDGYVLSDLEDCGFTFNSSKRKELLNNILLNYHIKLDKDKCLTTTTSIDNFAFKKHFYIQGILAINDLYTTSRSTVASLFAEDVAEFLDMNELDYNENIKLTGKSGYDHNIDYIFSGSKRKNIPERYLKVINNPNKSNTESTLFTWNDIKNTRKKDNKMYVVLNDTNSKIKSDILTAYKAYDIEPLLWSDKDYILSKLSNAI